MASLTTHEMAACTSSRAESAQATCARPRPGASLLRIAKSSAKHVARGIAPVAGNGAFPHRRCYAAVTRHVPGPALTYHTYPINATDPVRVYLPFEYTPPLELLNPADLAPRTLERELTATLGAVAAALRDAAAAGVPADLVPATPRLLAYCGAAYRLLVGPGAPVGHRLLVATLISYVRPPPAGGDAGGAGEGAAGAEGAPSVAATWRMLRDEVFALVGDACDASAGSTRGFLRDPGFLSHEQLVCFYEAAARCSAHGPPPAAAKRASVALLASEALARHGLRGGHPARLLAAWAALRAATAGACGAFRPSTLDLAALCACVEHAAPGMAGRTLADAAAAAATFPAPAFSTAPLRLVRTLSEEALCRAAVDRDAELAAAVACTLAAALEAGSAFPPDLATQLRAAHAAAHAVRRGATAALRQEAARTAAALATVADAAADPLGLLDRWPAQVVWAPAAGAAAHAAAALAVRVGPAVLGCILVLASLLSS